MSHPPHLLLIRRVGDPDHGGEVQGRHRNGVQAGGPLGGERVEAAHRGAALAVRHRDLEDVQDPPANRALDRWCRPGDRGDPRRVGLTPPTELEAGLDLDLGVVPPCHLHLRRLPLECQGAGLGGAGSDLLDEPSVTGVGFELLLCQAERGAVVSLLGQGSEPTGQRPGPGARKPLYGAPPRSADPAGDGPEDPRECHALRVDAACGVGSAPEPRSAVRKPVLYADR